MELSLKVMEIKPSATLAVADKAKRLAAEGTRVISFAAGEPDFNPPENIGRAAYEAFKRGANKYTLTAGIPELRRAVADYTRRTVDLEYSAEDVIVTAGGKQAIYLALLALLNPGDETLIPQPYWVSYPELVGLCGGRSVFVPLNADFGPDPDLLEKAVTPKTKLLILNSPSNPTGKALSVKELAALGEVLKKHPRITVLCDDIYNMLTYDGERCPTLPQVVPELASRCIVVNGLSKTYAMTGWRVGWALGPSAFIKAMGKLQSQIISNITSIAQYAGVEALNGPQDHLADWTAQYKARRDRMHSLLCAVPGVKCRLPEGAFYLFADFSKYCGKTANGRTISDDLALAEYLLDAGKVAAVPGSAFGAPGFIRFSFATSMNAIDEGMTALTRALAQMS